MGTKTQDEMIQSAIRLPRGLHERLKKAGGERGMGEEVRRRLEVSFDAEAARGNPKMVYMLDAISSCADDIARDFGSWSEDAFAFEVLKGCVDILLRHFQPEGKPVPKPVAGGLADTFYRSETPKADELSRLYVNTWISFQPPREAAAAKRRPR